jgi:hypothetical protein
MEVIKIKSRNENEVVFATAFDMIKFHDEILSGKPVVFDYELTQCGEAIIPLKEA